MTEPSAGGRWDPGIDQRGYLPHARDAAIALLGVATLAAGGVATFVSSNGAGSAGLAASGVVLLLIALLGEKIEWLKVGNVEFHLREAARSLTRQADRLEAQGDASAAQLLRDEARQLLMHASPAVRVYEEVRRTLPRGAGRVIELSGIMDDARRYSQAEHPSAAAVREIFDSGGDGERVYALGLMQEEPDAGYLESILDAISDSRSAFEQGQALTAALQMAPLLGPPGKAQLAEAVREQLTPDGHIARSSNRRRVAEQLLGALKVEATPLSE